MFDEHVLQILLSVYEKVETLEVFIEHTLTKEQVPCLRTPEDKPDMTHLLRTTLVASPDSREPTLTFSSSQLSTQSDVVCRVVEKLKKKGNFSKNLLTLGFNQMSSNPLAQVSVSPSIEYVYPNQHTSRLQYSVWETLLQRVGDDLMTYLLETKALFMLVKDSCYVQLTGVPIYNMWPYAKYTSFGIKTRKKNEGKRKNKKSSKTRRQKMQKQKLPKLPPKSEVLLARENKLSCSTSSTSKRKAEPLEDSIATPGTSGNANKRRKLEDDLEDENKSPSNYRSVGMINSRNEYSCLSDVHVNEEMPCLDFMPNKSHLSQSSRKYKRTLSLDKTALGNESSAKKGKFQRRAFQIGSPEHKRHQNKKDVSVNSSKIYTCPMEGSPGQGSAIPSEREMTAHAKGFKQKSLLRDQSTAGQGGRVGDIPFWMDWSDDAARPSGYLDFTSTAETVKPTSSNDFTGIKDKKDSLNTHTSLTEAQSVDSMRTFVSEKCAAQRTSTAAMGRDGVKDAESSEVTAVPEPVTVHIRSNTPFDRTFIFYAQDLRERFPEGYITSLMELDNPQQFVEDVLSMHYDGLVTNGNESMKAENVNKKSTDSKVDRSDSLPVSCCKYLTSVFQMLSTKLRIINTRKMLNELWTVPHNPDLDTTSGTGTSAPNTSLDHADRPQLCAPVFTRHVDLSRDHSCGSGRGTSKDFTSTDQDTTAPEDKTPSTHCISQDTAAPKDKTSFTEHTSQDKGTPEHKTPSKGLKERKVRKSAKQRKSAALDQLAVKTLLQIFMSHDKVFVFVRGIVDRLFPTSLFGSIKNKKLFFKGVKTFIGLGRYEKFSVGTLMMGMKLRTVGWLKRLKNQQKRVVFTQVLSWVFQHIVMGLLKAHFYITDTTLYRNRMFYYRKLLWRCIRHKAVQGDMRLLQIKLDNLQEEAEGLLNSGRSLGVAYMRFLPKASSLRPIVNLGRPYTRANGTTLTAVNRQLRALLAVLTFEKDENPELLGASTFSLDDTYQRWRSFILQRHSKDDTRPLYFVKVDIEGCFDSVKQDKLFQIIASLLNKKCDYVIRKYCTITSGEKNLKRTFKRTACPLYKFTPDFVQFVKKWIKLKSCQNVIFVDQVLHDHENSTDLLEQLKAHLQGNIIKIGMDYYLQIQGISQGSVLSTLLCNFYYGEMEKRHLVVLADELLVRQVDDFLFVSPYRENAIRFLSKMVTGIKDYGCKVNPQKTLTNFEIPEYYTEIVPSKVLVPWCGMLLDPLSLEVRVDYMRYEGISVQEITTLELGTTPGQIMSRKLFSSLRSRCHGMFLDPKINSLPVLIENTFKLFLMAAYKFHHNVLHLPTNRRVVNNVRFFKNMIQHLPHQFIRCMKKKTLQVCFSSQLLLAGSLHNPLKLKIIQWVCAKAFILKLANYRGMYLPLLKWLEKMAKRMDAEQMSLGFLCDHIPDDFLGILE